MLASQQVGRCEQGALEPGAGGRSQGMGGNGGLARPNIALEQAEHGRRSGQVAPDRVHRRDLVDRERDGLADSGPDRFDERRPDRIIRGRIQGHDRRGVADPLTAALDHPDLEGKELIEGEARERRVAGFEGFRIVSRLHGLPDRHESFLGHDRSREVLGVGMPGHVERLPDGRPKARRPLTDGRKSVSSPSSSWGLHP